MKDNKNYKELISPSGFNFTIREQNGDDDDVLSNGKNSAEGTSAAYFLAGIVIKTDFTATGKLTPEDAMNLKLCDKYFLIIASRIFSLGQFLKFEYEWPDYPVPVMYEEDLMNFIWEYGDKEKPFPEKGKEEYFQFRILPHPKGREGSMEFTISTEKTFKFDFVNTHGEIYQMGLKPEEQNKNQELKARNLQQSINGEWVNVENFRNFSAPEMREIRTQVLDNDPVLALFTELPHPKDENKAEFISIVATPDFFYPREI